MHLCKPSKLSIRGADESTANDDTEDCEDEKVCHFIVIFGVRYNDPVQNQDQTDVINSYVHG